MSFQLIIPGINLSDYKTILPAHFSGPVLSGAVVCAARKNQVEINVQEIHYPDFSIRHIYGKLIRHILARHWHKEEGLFGCFILKNTISKHIAPDKALLLPDNHHSLYYTFPSDCEGTIQDPGVFEMLEIFYSPAILQQLTEFFPKLNAVIRGHVNLTETGVKRTPPLLKEIYSQFFSHPYDAGLQQLYFDVKVRELLFHLLHSYTGQNLPAINFTPYETGRIREAKAVLETYIHRKPPTIRELSRMVALNEFKLKRGFRQLYDASIFDWITTEKMYHGRKLLEETQKPIKEIGCLCGYPRVTNFITAFKKQFGITPGAIRRS